MTPVICVLDLAARDPVIYRVMGESKPLRTVQYSINWLNGKSTKQLRTVQYSINWLNGKSDMKLQRGSQLLQNNSRHKSNSI